MHFIVRVSHTVALYPLAAYWFRIRWYHLSAIAAKTANRLFLLRVCVSIATTSMPDIFAHGSRVLFIFIAKVWKPKQLYQIENSFRKNEFSSRFSLSLSLLLLYHRHRLLCSLFIQWERNTLLSSLSTEFQILCENVLYFFWFHSFHQHLNGQRVVHAVAELRLRLIFPFRFSLYTGTWQYDPMTKRMAFVNYDCETKNFFCHTSRERSRERERPSCNVCAH